MVSSTAATNSATHVLVIGDGVIGLSIAYALGRAGAAGVLVGARHAGMASTAAAGLLLPNVEQLPPASRPFFTASLNVYPAFVDRLRDFDPSLRLIQGLVEITSEIASAGKPRSRDNDGAVDNVRLVATLRAAVAAQPTISIVEDDAVLRIELTSPTAKVVTRSGREITAERVVIAAGAWAPRIEGLPRSLPVYPLKGQMLALGASPLERPVVGEDVYLVPRGDETLVGATVEHAGFDLTIDPTAIETLRTAAIRTCPALANAPVTRTWAGTRPATPDLLPILGPDPRDERLIYACGHGKNGILLAPATANAIRDVVLTNATRIDISAFGVNRFPSVD